MILGLDVSTKTIGVCIFEETGNLQELTHMTPKIKPLPENDLEVLFKKVESFKDFIYLKGFDKLNITKIVIEEPLLGSNNVYTMATLLKFNGMISKTCYEIFNVVPSFISSYDARAYGFPELMGVRKFNKKGEPYTEKEISKKDKVLFGDYPWEVDKKQVVWDKVASLEPQIVWIYDKKMKLKKENFDMTDSYCAVLGYMRKMGFWK